jgi:hypothetical protein
MRTSIDRNQLQRLLQRHRRVLAAALAGLATLMALSVIRAPQDSPTSSVTILGNAQPGPGEVAVPVMLKDQAIASIAEPGDLVDILAVAKAGVGSEVTQPATQIVARRARVIETSQPDSGFMPLASGLLVVAVDEATALDLASAAATSDLSIAVHPSA